MYSIFSSLLISFPPRTLWFPLGYMIDRSADSAKFCVCRLIQKPGDAPDDFVPVHTFLLFSLFDRFFVFTIELFCYLCYDAVRALQSPDYFMDQMKICFILLPQQKDNLYNDRILPKAHIDPASL